MKRTFDFVAAIIGLIILSPVFIITAIVILVDDGYPVFFKQKRVGLHGRMFEVVKFRTMVRNAEKAGKLTVSGRDPRITKSGYLLRKFKIDELPQLFNVVVGDMSLVGPRPEVSDYVDHYTQDQRIVLSVRPGITDWASLEFINENELLARASDPKAHYVEHILPRKLALQEEYVRNRSFARDLAIIIRTVVRIIR